MSNDDMLSVREAAERFGTHPRTIRRWIESGHLPAYRHGPTAYRVDPADLDALRAPVEIGAER